jgi:radical SAM protein with 4Fe4S-binding SPASM domain
MNIKYTPIGEKVFSAPSTVHVELTNACNLRCRHCYNFWRQENYCAQKMTKDQFEFLISEFKKNKVFHVILTGGEPLSNFDVLIWAIKSLVENGLTVSCNSNLMLATPEKMRELKEAGLPHILTSLNSYKKETNDFLTSIPGSYDKILEGIKITVAAGIRVSVNMIISKSNIRDIYETARLAAELGAVKFNATRTVPPVGEGSSFRNEFEINKEDAKYILEELKKIKRDINIGYGALIPFPHCFLGNLEDCPGLLMRGCPAGSKMMSINVDGSTHACVHEEESYGNIFEIGMEKVWENMKKWRTGELIPASCRECSLFDECNGGCRMIGLSYYGSLDKPDNLKIVKDNIENSKYKEMLDKMKIDKIKKSDNIRVRKEKNFYAINSFGSETQVVDEWPSNDENK